MRREAPERQRLISSGQTHHLGEKKKCKKKLPLFLEKPRLKILGKIRYHFQPLRPQSHSYLCFLSPPPPRCHWLSAPEFKHTSLSPWGGEGKKARMKQDLCLPRSPLQPPPYLPPTLPQQTRCERVLWSGAQSTARGHLASTIPITQNLHSPKAAADNHQRLLHLRSVLHLPPFNRQPLPGADVPPL